MRAGPDRRGPRGFTLIEVIGALVIFSVGVLMVLGLTRALSVQLRSSGIRSMVSVAVQERLDSLGNVPYDSLALGSRTDTLRLLDRTFLRTHTVLQVTPLVREVEVRVVPVDEGGGRLTSSTFVQRPW